MRQKYLLIFLTIFLTSSLFSGKNLASETIWSKNEKRILKSLSLRSLPPLPIDPSNRYVLNPQAKKLGEQIFFDPQFSGNGKLSCASCHQPQHYFTDGIAHAKGIHASGRNTQTLIGSAWMQWFYWDGRRDSLWSQALVPFEAADEMGGSRMEVVRHVGENNNLHTLYENIFGSFPLELLNNNLPVRAGPLGNKQTQDNWFTLSPELQKTINQVYSNIGKAIAAYEITLVPQETRFDRYVDVIFKESISSEKNNTFSKNEIAGLKLFINSEKTQCLQCHNGPLFTNGGFHNIGTGKFTGKSLDFGRMLGLQAVLMDEFNCLGSFSDALPKDCSNLRFLNKSSHIPLQGAYKTPSLRYAQLTTPYMHDGRFKTLNDVMQHYNNPPENNGNHELRSLQLLENELEDLITFVKTLSDF